MEDTPHFAQMQTYLFPYLASFIFLLLHWIVYRGLLYHFAKNRKIQNILKFLVLLNFIATVSYMFLRQSPFVAQWIYFLFSVCIGIAFSFFSATIIYQFLALFLRIIKDKYKIPVYKNYLQKTIVLLSIVYIGYGIYNGESKPTIKEISIPVANLSSALRIVQLSDIHIGGLIKENKVKEFVKIANEQNSDIIVLTGDIVDTNSQNAQNAINELKNLRSTYGVYYVLGNHEYMHDLDNIIKKIKSLGFNTLINENILISKEDNSALINIAGVADLIGNRFGYLKPDIDKTLEGINPTIPTVLLSHQPKIINYIHNKPIDIILSGHTHGGQIFPFHLAVLLDQPYLMGLHQISKNTSLYIAQGTGFWGPPMRVGSHSEITIINMIPKQLQTIL